MISCAYGNLNVKHHLTTPKPAIHSSISAGEKTKLRWPENSIEHQNVHRRRSSSSSSSASTYIRWYTSEADFHKPEIYGGRVRVWATEWDVFHCTPSRGGRGRRAAVDIFRGALFSVWWDFVFFFRCLYFERTRPAASMRPPCLMFLSTSTGVRTGCHHLISMSVCLSVCVTFVVYIDCESCMRPISQTRYLWERASMG